MSHQLTEREIDALFDEAKDHPIRVWAQAEEIGLDGLRKYAIRVILCADDKYPLMVRLRAAQANHDYDLDKIRDNIFLEAQKAGLLQ